MSKRRVAVLGASGMVGQRFCEMLSDHPFFDLPALYASERSGGRKLNDVLLLPEPRISQELLDAKIEALDINAITAERFDIIFSALPTAVAKEVEGELRKRGQRIFTNASPYRMEKDVPLVVPEVNHEHLDLVRDSGFIVANGNCSAIGLALGLKPLQPLGISRVEVTTLQALSGAGYPGVPSLDALSNVIPYIDGEEEKLEREVPKMLGTVENGAIKPAPISIRATCTRVPVREGHLESVSVDVERDTDEREVEELFSNFRSLPQELQLPSAPRRPIIVSSSHLRPQPALDVNAGEPQRARGMAATVGRVRVRGRNVRFIILSHNTIRGAAGGSVLNAELMHSRGMM